MCSRARDWNFFKSFGLEHANAPIVDSQPEFVSLCVIDMDPEMPPIVGPPIDVALVYINDTPEHIAVYRALQDALKKYLNCNVVLVDGQNNNG